MLAAPPAGPVPENANEQCVGPEHEQAGQAASCAGCPNQEACASGPKGPDPDLLAIRQRMRDIRHKILVLSGKGGVGKSTFAAQLALALAASDRDVGLLDIDICGPSVPKMMGLEGQEIHQSANGWSPVYVDTADGTLGVMSIGFMLPNSDDPVIWRGPRKNGLIKQFMKDVHWGQLDYLVVDTPPGTSDEHISAVQFLKDCDVDGALIVTTPQEVSIIDVRKEINFCKKVGLPVLGVVENMSGLRHRLGDFRFLRRDGEGGAEADVTAAVLQRIREVAPELEDVVASTDVFHPSGGGAAAMAADMGVPFLGRVPLDAALSRAAEEGRSAFAPAPSNGVSTTQPAVGHANGTPAVQSTNGHTDFGSRGKGRASTGALPALQAIIDKVIAAAEGSMLAA